MRRQRIVRAVPVAVLMWVGACGGDDGESTPSTSAPTSATTTIAVVTTPAPPTSSSPSPTSPTSTTSTSTSTSTTTSTTTTLPPPCLTLRDCAERRGFRIGTYLNPVSYPDPAFREIVAREFNLAVVSAGFYWSDVEPVRGRYDLAGVDEQVEYARAHDMSIVGHALLLAQTPYIPDWLATGDFSRDELEGLLRIYIGQVMTSYQGVIDTYIVVEDAPLEHDVGRDVFYAQFGYDYVELAFQIAQETDPDAVLIYNADDNETLDAEASDLTHEIVDRLKAKGLIDGIGMEMHLDATSAPNKADVIEAMRSYGLPVHVTEIDVDLSNVPGTDDERYAEQARIYADMLDACLESGVCESFSVWGIVDQHSWLERESATADPTLFDDDLQPKPAFSAVLDALHDSAQVSEPSPAQRRSALVHDHAPFLR